MEVRDPKIFLDYHARMHERTARVIDCIPRSDLEWAPGPGRFSFGDMVRHLAGIERFMYAEAAAGRANRYPGHGRDLADGLDAVRGYYDRLHDESREIFSSLTADRVPGARADASRHVDHALEVAPGDARTRGASSRATLHDARAARRDHAADLRADVRGSPRPCRALRLAP